MRRFLAFMVCLVALLGCQDAHKKVADLNNEVLEAHDSSMVKMDAVYLQVSQLRKVEQALAADSLSDPAARHEVLEAITDLNRADEGMMDWMRNYQVPDKEADPQSTLQYLNGQMEAIVKVDQDLDASLARGQAVLDKYKSE